jgi:hypothetical protein
MTGSANSSVRPPAVNPDKLVAFIGELRLLGFRISTQQYIDSQNLLIALAARGLLPHEPQRLRTLLGPLLCSSPNEQETFYRLYDQWFVSQGPPGTGPDDDEGPPEKQTGPFLNGVRAGLSRLRPQWWLVLVALPLLALAVYAYKIIWPARTGVAPVTDGAASGGQGFWNLTYYVGVPLLMLGAMLGAGWLLKKSHRRLQLEKWRSAKNPELAQLVVKRPTEQLFQGADFRSVIQQMRRHRRSGAASLDVPKTIDATVGRGGWFTPVYSSQHVLPEYLILVDRVNYRDQQAQLEVEIVNRLREHNVHIEQYYFQGDPRVCQREGPRAQHLSLQDLAALHPEHYLLMFSDGAGLLNPLTGRPQPWLEMLSPWRGRALLTPESPADWGYREWALSSLDMFVLPAHVDGMAALIHAIHMGSPPEMLGDHGSRSFPEMLQERRERWLESLKPEPAVVDTLCSELRRYLGEEGFHWLSACAVYPVLHWNLTLYFGYELMRRERFEESLLALVRLPWFRYGSMPDWLRSRLIADLPEEQERLIRQKLEELLISSLEQPQTGFPLQFAPPDDSKWGGWKSLRAGLSKIIAIRKRRGVLCSVIETEPEDSPLRDNVLLTFISGRKPGRLAVAIPHNLSQLLLAGRRPGKPAATSPNVFRRFLSVLISSATGKAKPVTVNQPPLTTEHASPVSPVTYWLRPAIIGGIFAGVLSVIPIVSTLCCGWAMLGGVIASRLYVRRSPHALTAGDGAKVGAMTGFVASIIYVPITLLMSFFLGLPESSPDLSTAEAGLSYPQLVIIVLVTALIIASFSTFAGFIAVPYYASRKER